MATTSLCSKRDDASFWAYKLAVLLHDVPWKPCIVAAPSRRRVVTGGRRGYILDCCGLRLEVPSEGELLKEYGLKSLEKNDIEAIGVLHLLRRLLEARGFREASEALRRVIESWDKVAKADSRASTLDRLLLGSICHKLKKDDDPCNCRLDDMRIVNIFKPHVYFKLPWRVCEELEERVEGFLRGLLEAVDVVLGDLRGRGDTATVLRVVYNVVYALLEPLWYRYNPGFVAPADTRFPTHSVIDHLYASVLASNLVIGGRSAEAVVIDFPGIQEFVSKGRKTRDYWSGSWILSLLAWKAVEPLVEEYGPDILVSPAASSNPFYYAYLVKLVEDVAGVEAARRVSSILAESSFAWRRGWPSQPLMPATTILILPCSIPRDKLQRIVESAVKEAWQKLAEKAFEFLDILTKGTSGEEQAGIETLADILCGDRCEDEAHSQLVKLYNDYIEEVKRKPPISPIVAVANVNAVSSSVTQRLYAIRQGMPEIEDYVSLEKLRDILEFDALLECVFVTEKPSVDKLRVLPPARYIRSVHTLTETAYNRRRVVRRCSVCGIMPEVIRVRRGYRGHVILDEREHLCPVCLVKRLLPLTIKRVVSELFGSVVGGNAFTLQVLSTSDLSDYWMAPRAERRVLEETGERFEDARTLVLDVVRVVGVEREDNLDQFVDHVAATLSEASIKPVERPRLVEYAVVMGDGDRIGSGYWRGDLGVEPYEYVMSVHEVVRCVGEEAAKLHAKVFELLVKAAGRATTILTPSYIYTFSRSLMATALVDEVVVRSLGGVLVYAGGDDIYAMVPLHAPPWRVDRKTYLNPALVSLIAGYASIYSKNPYNVPLKKLLDRLVELLGCKDGCWNLSLPVAVVAVYTTRLNYWGIVDSWNPVIGDFTPGFHVIPGLAAAATVAYGRSYGLNVAHYRDPLWSVYNAVHELEDMKDEVSHAKRNKVEKDVTIAAYKRHLGDKPSIIPNVDPDACKEHRIVDALRNSPLAATIWILSRIGRGLLFSRSLIYDLAEPIGSKNYQEMYDELGASIDEIVRLYIHVFSSNARRRPSTELLEMLRRLAEHQVLTAQKNVRSIHIVSKSLHKLAP
ncbi:hypothetical protein Pyrfu_0447 [Pyrolobus fumarii 1A]|uniref:CRISPR-associated protein Cmr2 N-terminal domain-containing protein n=1 Tax=Pyrolobus fumarii (strain DSM 11204 / 1A) TaxID=694429 RepID=G0EG70_PYRF1|nr:type III-B CRISPR-associated protein Cas10/Cmr2 [Pyrolobus fumarii]AEM38318.1 hypothetical protein Pyrfu_0447 [Pyrolobus fumarii 1A]